MYIFTVIGGTGQGKTTFVKKLTANKNLLVYDVNGEWQDVPMMDANNPQSRCRVFCETKDFMKLAQERHRGTFVVFEEATAFFVGAMQKAVRAMCIGKRHPVDKGGRNIVFLFHTIQSVPPFLLDMSDYLILFKTGDDLNAVKKKRAKLLKPFIELYNAPKFSHRIIKNV